MLSRKPLTQTAGPGVRPIPSYSESRLVLGFGLAQLGQMSPVVREQELLAKFGPLPAPDH